MSRRRIDYPTEIQERILRRIRQQIEERGEAPTLQEIGAVIGVNSRSTVHYHLVELETKGAIVRERGRTRGIHLA